MAQAGGRQPAAGAEPASPVDGADPAREFVVLRAAPDDWRAVRSVRLAALADAPSAFGSELGTERGFTEDRWRSWTQSAAVLVAHLGDEPCGMAAGIPGETPQSRRLVAMWVAPAARGRGASGLLLDGVEQWALADGAVSLQLWVTRGNDPARRLYERRGYVSTGRSVTLPRGTRAIGDEMVGDLRR